MSTASSQIRILAVDDHALVREGIAGLIGVQPDMVLTGEASTGDVQILRALKAGAQAYLLKNTLHKELLETIRAVHAGKKALSPEASYEIAEHATDCLLYTSDAADEEDS